MSGARPVPNVRSYRGSGVVGARRVRGPARARRHGPDAQVQGQNGRYGIYFAPWAVSDGASQWLDGFETVEEAMEAADRYVATYLDG
jgi:hypothetical protein